MGRLLEPWAARAGIPTDHFAEHFYLAMDTPVGEEQAEVVRALAERIGEIGTALHGKHEVEEVGKGEEQDDEPYP